MQRGARTPGAVLSARVSASSQSCRQKRTQGRRVGSSPRGHPRSLLRGRQRWRNRASKAAGGVEAGHREEQRLPDASKGHGVPLPGAFPGAGGAPCGVGPQPPTPWQGQRPGASGTCQESKEAGTNSPQGRGTEGGRVGKGLAALTGQGSLPAGGAAVWVCVAQPLSGPGAGGSPGQSLFPELPPPRRCFRVLPGKPAAGRSG